MKQSDRQQKSLVLLSGGLDSRLACKIMQEQSSIEAFYVHLPFTSTKIYEIKKFCKANKIKLKIVDVTKDKLLQKYLDIVKKPRYGYGSAINPCIDCHIFLLKLAKKYADSKKIKIITTGEVLGERPFSQHKRALDIIEKESGTEILRPLSAKLLPETRAEKDKLVDRSRLFDIQGRQRKRQIELARKYKISFPSPAGGCLLCEKEFCRKLSPLLNKNLSKFDIELLKLGRHFLNSEIILGRNEKENEKIEKIFSGHKKGILLIPKQPGPTALVKDKKLVDEAKKLIQKYSKHKIEGIEVK